MKINPITFKSNKQDISQNKQNNSDYMLFDTIRDREILKVYDEFQRNPELSAIHISYKKEKDKTPKVNVEKLYTRTKKTVKAKNNKPSILERIKLMINRKDK